MAEKYGYVLVGVVRFLDLIWLRKDLLEKKVEEDCTGTKFKSTNNYTTTQQCLDYFRVPPFEWWFRDHVGTDHELRLAHLWPISRGAAAPLRKEVVDIPTLLRTRNATVAHRVARNRLRKTRQLVCFKKLYETL